MKKIIFVLVLILSFSVSSLAVSNKYPSLSLNFRLGKLFMEMSEITLKKTGVKPGTIAYLLYKTNGMPLIGEWNPKLDQFRLVRSIIVDEKVEYYNLPKTKKSIQTMGATNIVDEGDSWEAAWRSLAALAARHDMETARGDKPFGFNASYRHYQNYYADFMISNLDWFRDNKGKLHIPKFLLERYKEKYIKEGKK